MRQIFLALMFFSSGLFAKEPVAIFANGVVFDSRQLEHYSWDWAFHQMGREISLDQYQGWIGLTKSELEELFYHDFGCTWDPSVFQLHNGEYARIFAKGITPREGALELIDALKRDGVPVILITSIPMEQTFIGLEKLNLQNAFDKVIHVKALHQLDPCLVITDSGKIATKMKDHGFTVFGVPYDLTLNDDFSSADFVFEDLSDIYNAH